MSEQSLELTILMPCLNEEQTLGICIDKAQTYLRESGVEGEVLIADNGSTDRSIEIAEEKGARVVNITEKGYGSALLGGIKAARGTYVIMGDSDDSYNFLALQPFVDELRKGHQLVMGNRFRGGIEKGAMPFLHRYLGNPVLSFIGRLFFNIPARDFHCGLRGFHRESILAIGLKTTGMEFASEMVVKASLNELRMAEVPTTLSPDGRDRPPHLNTWRDGWRHLKFLLIYSPAWSLLYPGLVILGLGLILSVLLLISPLEFSGIRLDIHTLLLAMSFCFVGFQLASMYIFAKEYGVHQGHLPPSELPTFWDKLFRLENALMLGALLVLGGLILVVYSLFYWKGTGFSDLDPTYTLRLVIPAVFATIFGVQLIISGFLREMLHQ